MFGSDSMPTRCLTDSAFLFRCDAAYLVREDGLFTSSRPYNERCVIIVEQRMVGEVEVIRSPPLGKRFRFRVRVVRAVEAKLRDRARGVTPPWLGRIQSKSLFLSWLADLALG